MDIFVMEKLVNELKQVVSFKETTAPGDLVLVATEKPRMLSYAYISAIERDAGRHDEWWHITMHLLSIPSRQVTWTLRTPQFTGQEIFTMGGNKCFVKAVSFPAAKETVPRDEEVVAGRASGKKIPFRVIKK